MEKTIPSLKQFAAWAIGLTDKYRYNLYVRTTVHIILLQIGLTVLTIGVFWWAVTYAQQSVVNTISTHIAELLSGEATTTQGLLPVAIEAARRETLTLAFFGLAVLAGLFGVLVAKFALRPARNSLQFQKRFIGNVAHEIRTPLAIMKTNTEVALMDPGLSKSMRETLESTIEELDRASETINNLLSFDNLMRPTRIKPIVIDIAALAEAVLERHRAFARSRGIRLTLEKGSSPKIYGKPAAVDQIVTNLVKNAINYTPKDSDGSVTVSIDTNLKDEVVVSVTDTGIGIAESDLYHIFEPFYRADTSRARGIGTGSSGLGLAIVNELVRLHRGSITIRSAVGHGTTFKVTFPQATGVTTAKEQKESAPGAHEVSIDFS